MPSEPATGSQRGAGVAARVGWLVAVVAGLLVAGVLAVVGTSYVDAPGGAGGTTTRGAHESVWQTTGRSQLAEAGGGHGEADGSGAPQPEGAAREAMPAGASSEDRDDAAPHAGAELEHTALQGTLDRWLSGRGAVDGIVVAVARRGEDAAVWVGAAARPHAAAIDPGARYPILSVTKTFTQALVLREAAAGRLHLDAAMPELPEVAPAPEGVVITPRMLLQHTSGVVNYKSAHDYDPTAEVTPAELVSMSLRTPLLHAPGSAASYSNTNYHWLGLLIEHTSGRPYGALVDELAAEAGLTATALDVPPRLGWVGYASGGIAATAADVARWAAALFTPGMILEAGDVDLLTTVGPLGVSHGLWPLCPPADAGAAPGQPADDECPLGQVVADGGLVHDPATGLTVVVHFPAGAAAVGALTAEVATVLADTVEAASDMPARGTFR